MSTNSIEKIKQLPIWKDKINVKTLGGGLTNQNFLVEDKSQKLVVRLGKDILEHQVLRSNELIATKAAYESGLGPKIIYNSISQYLLSLHF